MSLLVDKYRPKDFSKLDFHVEQAQHLKKLIAGGDFPHMLLYGPPGAGKNTRVMCVLRELYGSGVERLRIDHQNITTASNKKLEIYTIASNYHIMVNPSDVGIHDRCVIQEVIKNTASTQQLDPTGQREFKVVVLTEVDKLTKDAQHALRRTMEKYIATCRLILIANSTSKIIPAIRSRCLGVRVSAPTHEEIVSVLQTVSKKEGFNLPMKLAEKIAEQSNRNLRRALLALEACKAQEYPFSMNQKVPEPDWETFIRKTASCAIQEQSPSSLLQVRENLYELLSHCIPADTIFKCLLKELAKNCDESLKYKVTELAAYHEHRLQLGSKSIYHLEAFVAQFMAEYAQFIEAAMCDMLS